MELWFIFGILGYLSYAISTSIDEYLMDIKYEIVKTNSFKMLFDGLIIFLIGLMFFKLSFTPKLFLYSLVLGFIYALSGIIYFELLRLRDVEEVIPFLHSSKILIVFIGSLILFSEIAGPLNYLGIFLLLLGIYSVFSENGIKVPKANKTFLLIIVEILIGVIYAFLVKGLLFDIKPIDLAIMMYFSTTLILFSYQFLFKKETLKSIIDFKPKISKIILAAFFGSMGTFLIYSALSLGYASKVYPMAGLESVFLFIIASLFLRKRLCWHRLIGVIIVFAGIYLISL